MNVQPSQSLRDLFGQGLYSQCVDEQNLCLEDGHKSQLLASNQLAKWC